MYIALKMGNVLDRRGNIEDSLSNSYCSLGGSQSFTFVRDPRLVSTRRRSSSRRRSSASASARRRSKGGDKEGEEEGGAEVEGDDGGVEEKFDDGDDGDDGAGEEDFDEGALLRDIEENYEVVAALSEGGQFGELGMLQGLQGSPRLATAVAVQDTHLFSLHAKDVARMAQHSEDEAGFWAVMEGEIYQWLAQVDTGQHPATPDLEMLKKLSAGVDSVAGPKASELTPAGRVRSQSFSARAEAAEQEEFGNKNMHLDHNASPWVKLRRCVWTVRAVTRWKRCSDVKVEVEHIAPSLVTCLRKQTIAGELTARSATFGPDLNIHTD
jgi:hypothetical protein